MRRKEVGDLLLVISNISGHVGDVEWFLTGTEIRLRHSLRQAETVMTQPRFGHHITDSVDTLVKNE